MARSLKELIQRTHLAPNETAARTKRIYETVLAQSQHLDEGNFTAIHTDDLARLFALYDDIFFERCCRATLGDLPFHLRLSKRMTQAGGRTTRYTPRGGTGKPFYEIAVSSTLLFHTFDDVQRPIRVNGLVCRDRLEALERIFEHELIHLVEMLLWTHSSCARPRFQSIAARFFQHSDHRHGLVTPLEQAAAKYGLRPGDRVRFRIDGAKHVGLLNRITRRATVLVEDPRGAAYTDGKRYRKFYVPVTMLEKVE
jgi:hypothetical protein